MRGGQAENAKRQPSVATQIRPRVATAKPAKENDSETLIPA